MNRKTILASILLVAFGLFSSCSRDDGKKEITTGGEQSNTLDLSKDYTKLFRYNGVSDGEAFINQLIELNNKVNKTTFYSQEEFNNLYERKIKTALGQVTIKDWTATSSDLFGMQPSLKQKVQSDFNKGVQDLIQLRLNIVKNPQKASKGNYGQIGSDITREYRYVDGNGLEVSEMVEKQIMGVILLDQILNQNLGDHIIKNSDLRAKNTQRKFMAGKQFTELEYHWDLAYALLGSENRDATPKFIANYLIKEFQGSDFLKGADKRVFDAFKKGRKALEQSDYDTVEAQIKVIRETLSKLYAIRCVHYLKQARTNLQSQEGSSEYLKAFHPLSEAYGFIYAFVVTRKADGTFYIQDYGTLQQIIKSLKGENGFWDQDRLLGDENTTGSLLNIEKKIGQIFGFDTNQVI